jgi:transposase
METEWIVDRTRLWALLEQQPSLSTAKLAQQLKRSPAWVRKWRRRLRETTADDPQRFHSRSRRPQTSPYQISERVEARIVALRDTLPEQYHRKVGGKTILYHLHQQQDLAQERLPRSSSTVWRILDRHHRLLRRNPQVHLPMVRPEPMQVWEVDFCDVPSAIAPPDGRQAHAVEVFNVLDRGTSWCVDLQASDHYDAEYTLLATAQTLLLNGLPRTLICDRDPRLVSSWTSDDFPSAWMRFLLCLGVDVQVLPPHRPDLKPVVERFIRTRGS